MWYAIIAEDMPDSLEKRNQHRAAHRQRLEELTQSGRLLVAGPHPHIDNEEPGEAGYSGSLIIAEFDNQQAAQEWARDDPFALAGVYARITVKPFKKVLPPTTGDAE